ncbi:hypothetical protein HU200_049833 [Digitaria exilis]|uniref:Uncharacterized protein n=1 Tax=Digitaria exilis TaxID=1010633 RepID=A0A835E853_9POAL|nr:hypothetical protein HU200_049833 [Digitaria exilis]
MACGVPKISIAKDGLMPSSVSSRLLIALVVARARVCVPIVSTRTRPTPTAPHAPAPGSDQVPLSEPDGRTIARRTGQTGPVPDGSGTLAPIRLAAVWTDKVATRARDAEWLRRGSFRLFPFPLRPPSVVVFPPPPQLPRQAPNTHARHPRPASGFPDPASERAAMAAGQIRVTMEVGADGVALITIANPPVNALHPISKRPGSAPPAPFHFSLVIAGLKDKYAEAMRRDDVKAIVLTGQISRLTSLQGLA